MTPGPLTARCPVAARPYDVQRRDLHGDVTQASDGTYAANSSPTTVTWATPATLTLTSTSGTALSPLTLTYAGNIDSGSANYTVDSAGTANCSIINSDTQLMATAPGSCTVTVSGQSSVQGQGQVSSPPRR